MAAEARIRLVVDNTQAKKAIGETEKAVSKVEESASKLKGAIAGAFTIAAIGVAIRQFVTIADQFTTLQNRLRVVTSTTAELSAVTKELVQVANSTRSSLAATAEVYSRVALSAKDLGISQRQVIDFTQSLNQAVALSGATGAEAQAGLIQLSQGLASGALRGDELRSVLEQLPVVADVIAKSLGVTRGELRTMGAEGKITADIVLKAFADAREELEGRFAKTVPTVSQAMEVLRNSFLISIGGANGATEATGLLSDALLGLSKAIPPVTNFLVSMFKTPIAGLVALTETLKTFNELLVAIGENIFNAIVSGVEKGLNKLVDGINKIRSILRQPLLDDFEFVRSDTARRSVADIAEDLGAVFKRTFQAAITPDEGTGFADLTKKTKSADQLFLEKFGAPPLVQDSIEPKFKPVGATLGEIEAVNKSLIKTPDLVGNIIESVNPLFDTLKTGFQTAEDQLVQFFHTGEFGFKQLVDSILDSLTRLLFRKGISALLSSLGGADFAAQLFGSQAVLPGKQHGGSWKVGGSGGTDSQVVAFRATPGEQVSVATRGQQQAAAQIAAPEVRLRVINQLDPNLALDALSTQAGERVVMNIIQSNSTTIRRVLGG